MNTNYFILVAITNTKLIISEPKIVGINVANYSIRLGLPLHDQWPVHYSVSSPKTWHSNNLWTTTASIQYSCFKYEFIKHIRWNVDQANFIYSLVGYEITPISSASVFLWWMFAFCSLEPGLQSITAEDGLKIVDCLGNV